MKGVVQNVCQRQPNFDSHVTEDRKMGTIVVVFELVQVLPVYRVTW
jgi:hypothetical protein